MTDTTAKIAAKGLKATGVTEELARKYYDDLGSKHLAIVELTVDGRTEKTDGKQQVQLTLSMVEPSIDPTLDDHLRELSRAMYFNRKLHSEDDQPALDSGDDIEPKVSDVLANGQALLEHDDNGEVVGLWDGNTDDDSDAANPGPDAYRPHDYIDTAHAVCGYQGCGQPADAQVHQHDDAPVPA